VEASGTANLRASEQGRRTMSEQEDARFFLSSHEDGRTFRASEKDYQKLPCIFKNNCYSKIIRDIALGPIS